MNLIWNSITVELFFVADADRNGKWENVVRLRVRISGEYGEKLVLKVSSASSTDGGTRGQPITKPFELWTGEQLNVRMAENALVETALKGTPSLTYLANVDLTEVAAEAPVVRADLTPAIHQPPAQNPSFLATRRASRWRRIPARRAGRRRTCRLSSAPVDERIKSG